MYDASSQEEMLPASGSTRGRDRDRREDDSSCREANLYSSRYEAKANDQII